MSGFQAAYESVPPVTRFLLVSTAAITLPCLLAMLDPADVALQWWKVKKHYEIWRPFTGFFFGGGGFPLLYDFFLIYRNSSSLEKDVYFGNTAEYAWMHLMLALFILAENILVGLPFLFRPLLHAQTYIWCRANPTMKVSIFGLLTIPTSLYPPALIALDLITGGTPKALGGLMGMISGHLWWYLSTYLPTQAPTHLRRRNPLSTPGWFASYIGTGPSGSGDGGMINTPWGGMRAGTASAKSPAAAAASGSARGGGGNAGAGGRADTTAMRQAAEARYRWGSGQRLGGEEL